MCVFPHVPLKRTVAIAREIALVTFVRYFSSVRACVCSGEGKVIFVLLFFFAFENVFFSFLYLTFVFSKRFTFLINKIVNHSITDANLVGASVF